MSATTGHQDGGKIRSYRKQRGLSVRDLASRIGIHPQSLRKVELNQGGAGIGVLLKLAAELHVPLTAILRSQDQT